MLCRFKRFFFQFCEYPARLGETANLLTYLCVYILFVYKSAKSKVVRRESEERLPVDLEKREMI